jgi:hypothetical protein
MHPAVHFGQNYPRLRASGLSQPFRGADVAAAGMQNQEPFKAKNLLDKRNDIARVPAINMKNSPLMTILLGVLTVSALASVVMCWLNISNTRELRALQTQVTLINNNQAMINALVNESVEYSKTHHEIEPVLESIGLKLNKTASAPASKPATK